MLFGKKQICLLSPCTGKSVPLSAVPDEVFSLGMLGVGFAVEPVEGRICSPVGGRVENVAESKHAFTVLSDEGLDVLVHVGVDTVSLGGEGFTPKVRAGQRIKAGEALVDADMELIRQKGLCTDVIVIVTTPEKIENTEYKFGSTVGARDAVMCFRTKKG
ncbi:MAG: PTS glucose transporter subunit IIA [Clostridia bacterium]|nr:PTS glucose transporter subunit IIA [Clostridia bacterium]